MQPVKLLVVKSDEAKEKLAKAANIYSAPVAIIVFADTDKAWTRPFDVIKEEFEKSFSQEDSVIIFKMSSSCEILRYGDSL